MLSKLPATLGLEKEHLTEVFANVNGFSVKDNHQIFHPSTQLRPAIDPAETHWSEEANTSPPQEVNKIPQENRYVEHPQSHTPCNTELDCSNRSFDVCIIYDAMSGRFCYSDL